MRDPAKSAQLNRGAYGGGARHCAECHSSRDRLEAYSGARLRWAGPEGKAGSRNNPHTDGITSWSDKDIAYRSRADSRSGYAASPRGRRRRQNIQAAADDRAAMASYIKALPPRPGKRPK